MAEPMRHFYVSAIDGDRRWLLAGPFDSHVEAQQKVALVQEIAYKHDPRSHFYSFGTAGTLAPHHTPLGNLVVNPASMAKRRRSS